MKVIIAGTRGVNDYKLLTEAVQRSGFDIKEVVSGCATGVDRLGERWAIANDVPIKEMPADWDRYGNSAGPFRNREMAKYADAAIIVWDGKSVGTRNMIENMIRLKKPYYIAMTESKDIKV